MMAAFALPIPNALVESLDYDPETGKLFWKITRRNGFCGKEAWHRNKGPHGYIRVVFLKKHYLAHRIAWTKIHGAIPSGMEIDHKNGDRYDNRIANLRLANVK